LKYQSSVLPVRAYANLTLSTFYILKPVYITHTQIYNLYLIHDLTHYI